MIQDSSNTFSIIVPVYNGKHALQEFLNTIPERLVAHFIFVDDGSSDGSGSILRSYPVKVISHEMNRGKGAAILTGVEAARVDGSLFVITMDVDLQHSLEMLDEFIHKDGDEFYCGYRFPRDNMPLQRQLSNFITSMLLTVRCNRVIKDSQCGYRRIPMSFFDKISVIEDGFQMESEILVKAAMLGYRINHINIPTIYTGSPSAINPLKDTLKFIELWLRSYLWN